MDKLDTWFTEKMWNKYKEFLDKPTIQYLDKFVEETKIGYPLYMNTIYLLPELKPKLTWPWVRVVVNNEDTLYIFIKIDFSIHSYQYSDFTSRVDKTVRDLEKSDYSVSYLDVTNESILLLAEPMIPKRYLSNKYN